MLLGYQEALVGVILLEAAVGGLKWRSLQPSFLHFYICLLVMRGRLQAVVIMEDEEKLM